MRSPRRDLKRRQSYSRYEHADSATLAENDSQSNHIEVMACQRDWGFDFS
jgi:hypothetical protein